MEPVPGEVVGAERSLVAATDWAISLVWCGKTRSLPPAWMSKVSPRCLRVIAEHSMCQPGRPCPHGESQDGSPGFAPFQSAKSSGSRFASPGSTRAPGHEIVEVALASRPYSGNFRTE